MAERNQRKVFAQIPEHIVKDMAQWFHFIATHGLEIHPRALTGLQVRGTQHSLLNFLCTMFESFDCNTVQCVVGFVVSPIRRCVRVFAEAARFSAWTNSGLQDHTGTACVCGDNQQKEGTVSRLFVCGTLRGFFLAMPESRKK